MRPTSPLATSGVGHDLETEVGAIYLTALLLGGRARGSTGGATVSVHFQRAGLDAPLDDLKIETESSVGRARLDLQVKRRFSFSAGDKKFSKVIDACWDTFADPAFQEVPSNYVGVATLNAAKSVKERVEEVAEWARGSTSAKDFFTRIDQEGRSRKDMRRFVDQIRTQVRKHTCEAVTEEALLEFFRRLVLVDFDVELQASRDRHNAIEQLRALVSEGDLEQATALFGHLRDALRAAGRTSGGYTEKTLREYLLMQSIAVLARPSFMNDLDRLRRYTRLILGSIQNSIEGLIIDRSTTIETILARVDEGQTIILIGPGGVGKSVVLRAIGEARISENSGFALAGDGLDAELRGSGDLATMLRLQRGLDELIPVLSGTSRPCLLIDGVEKINSAGARRAINHLLAALGELEANGGPRWAIVITTRNETLDAVREWLVLPGGGRGAEVPVPDFTMDEVAVVAERLPYLGWILTSDRLRPIVGNAYFLRVLAEARAEGPSDLNSVTESFVYSLWWERRVGPNRARQQAMLRIGKLSLERRTRRLLAEGCDPSVLSNLEVDGILRRDPGTDTYWFGHDILEEWTLARVLAQQDESIIEFLRSHREPFWAFRALQLLACARLEGAEGGAAWRDLLRQVEEDPVANARWIEAVLTAPLRSAQLAGLMSLVGETLLEGDGSRLARFLRAVRTVEIEPNRNLEPLAESLRLPSEDLEALALDMGHPRLQSWVGVLRWLAPRLRKLPAWLREEVSQMMVTWQRATPPGAPFRREIAEAALAWHEALHSRLSGQVYPSREAEPYFDNLRDIVVLAADVISGRIAAFLAELRQTRRRSELVNWLAQRHPELARFTPGVYADFFLDVLVPGWRGEASEASENDGQRLVRRSVPFSDRHVDPEWSRLKDDHDFRPPSQLRGPFLLVLDVSESDGLRLVNELVNRATRLQPRWRDELGSFEANVRLDLPWGVREFGGGRDVYGWFRPNSEAPDSVCSALMALEVWMEKQVKAGREPEELFQAVLAGSESVASVAVCIAICLGFPELCLRAAAPFVSSNQIWEFEFTRSSMDSHRTFFFQLPGRVPTPIEKAALDRDERPQRRRHIRDLMTVYFNEPDLALRNQVFEAVRSFSNDSLAVFGELENYRRAIREEGICAWFEAPLSLQERQAQVRSRLEAVTPHLELSLWVGKTLDQGAVDGRLTLAAAIGHAQDFERAGDFERPIEMDGDYGVERLQGIAGAAAAAVLLDIAWTQTSGNLAWCTRILVAAAEAPPSQSGFSDGAFSGSVKSSAAKGLMALLRSRLADLPARLAAFRLLQSTESGIVDIVFESVRELWDVDSVFCRNAIARELAFVVRPEGQQVGQFEVDYSAVKRWEQEIEERYLQNVRLGHLPGAFSLRPDQSCEFRAGRVRRALEAVPFGRVADGSEREWVLEVTNVGLAWTLSQYPEELGYVQQFGYDWLRFLGEWLARLAGALTESEIEDYIFAPLRSSWPGSAPLTAGLLYGYTVHRLVEEPLTAATVREWKTIADWVLPVGGNISPRRAIEEALDLLVHVRNGHGFLTREWNGAREFIEVYDRWVEARANQPWAFRALLAFAGQAGSRLGARRLLGWLTGAVEGVGNREEFWREGDTGRLTAQALAVLWKSEEREVRRDSEVLGQYADLLDELKRAGVPLAGQMLSTL